MIKGRRLSGRYRIIDMIGGGGMANVYLAHDMILDRDVAVKVLRMDFAEDEEFIRRFHREAQSATSLAHPNIVNIYDVGEEDSIYYIVMEYVDGQTLKQYIQQNSPIRIDDALEILKQLTSAISHAHQNHIIHRDIKPHNILIDRHGNVKITDFGIAMALSATSITQTNSVLGSVHYLSPEQARGGMANRKSDIYSLGIVMFELLTGRLPFSGESAVSIALKHLQSETPSLKRWNPSIPQSVENIVLKATAKDPFHRYDTVEEMEEDIRTALEPERLHEKKFIVPIDDDATKAIPVITDDRPYQSMDETLVHAKDPKGDTQPVANPLPEKKKKEKKKKKKWPIILVSVFLFLIVTGILAITVFPDLMEPKDVQVPDVSGKEVEDAVAELIAAGFTVRDTKPISDPDVEEGLVVKTDPKAGRTVKEGTSIDIYESSGKEKFELADYQGRQYDDVVRLLESKNFKSIEKNEETDDSEPAGTILDQNLSEGDLVVPEDTELIFTVSKGPAPIALKDLRGYNEKGLQEYEESSGLKVEYGEEEYHEEVPEGLVIKQDPAPGTNLTRGQKVTVVLSKGKKELLPKTENIEISIPYEPAAEGEPNEVQIIIKDLNNTGSEPMHTELIYEDVVIPIDLTIAPGQNASYKVLRDGQVFEEKEIPYPDEES
ncbi:Stk1 family PASTA domain-containing Ser/Thr kinase [Cytobacillus firmus]|uniref:Stk1 family PASTA domain-containing Ser/Thr kinase n=1 Tax=Bacillaceae TaxID=186817 RepID=UPI0013D80810|nr:MULTISPECIES: Stk1 family PASTA domain-containing Ser/Thr kinase [Bacillaceae]MCC3645641.1 Stk1 family PASTA domain-containing Ser/Thr kinase [Cytobacillus oceanisediminis]MCU1804537.1 Stk1 family PASTA domain-containing Ser/Thr kinase [Cytobacillus firmus]